jgi:hypothetical protein
MKTPCVVYFAKSLLYFAETFNATTSRGERIFGRISQNSMSDPARIILEIDGIDFETPDNLSYAGARRWVIEQIKSLGYFVIEK